MFGSFVNIGILTLLWIVNLFTGTGLDMVYRVSEKTMYLVYALFVLAVLMKKGRRRVSSGDFLAFGGMICIFLLSAALRGTESQAIGYLWAFCLVYLLSRIRVDDFVMLMTGLIYGAAGALVLIIYNFGSVFSGWNDNSIAMLGMHSFLVFLVPYYHRNSFRDKVIVLAAAFVFCTLLGATNSRSGMLFVVIGTLFSLNLIPRRFVLKRGGRITLALLVPVIIAVAVCVFSSSVDMYTVDMWSMEKFGKPLFNGRDELWLWGFQILGENLLIGSGFLNYANWHNNAVACLTAYGILGFLCWIASFKRILKRAFPWRGDYAVQGLMIGFIVLYVQQSVELGFIGSPPALIAYIMLGMLLGRVQYLNDLENRKVRYEA